MMKNLLIVASLAVLAAGCETGADVSAGAGAGMATDSALSGGKKAKHEAYIASVENWKGHSTSELKNAWGKAMGAQQGDEGKIWLVYFEEYTYGGGEYRVESANNVEVPSAGGGTQLVTQESLNSYGSNTKQVKRKCLTQFQINGDGMIDDVKVDGECRLSDLSDDQQVAPS